MNTITLYKTGSAGLILDYKVSANSVHQSTTLVQDPFYSHPGITQVLENVNPLGLPNVDATLLTHPHFDHASDLPNLPKKNKKAPLIMDGNYQFYPWVADYENIVDARHVESYEITDDVHVEPILNIHIKHDTRFKLHSLSQILRSNGLNLPSFLKQNLYDFPFSERETFSYILNFNNGTVGGYNIMTLGSCELSDDALQKAKRNNRQIDLLCLPVQGRTDILEHAFNLVNRLDPEPEEGSEKNDSLWPYTKVLIYHEDPVPKITEGIDVGPLEEMFNEQERGFENPGLGVPLEKKLG